MERRDSSAPFVPHLLFHRRICRSLFEPSPSPEEEQHPLPLRSFLEPRPFASPVPSFPSPQRNSKSNLSVSSAVRVLLASNLVVSFVVAWLFVGSMAIISRTRTRTRTRTCCVIWERSEGERNAKEVAKERRKGGTGGGGGGGTGSRGDGADGRDPRGQEGGGGGMREGNGTMLGDEGVAPAICRM